MATAKAFIDEIAPIIVRYAKQYGYKIASVTIAQACIESGYGNAWSRKNNNYFGIKYGSWVKRTTIADKISVVNAKTKEEYKPGTLTTIVDGFCKVPDMEYGVALYFEFLRVNSRYKNLRNCTTTQEMAEGLKKAGYATSSTYVSTLMNTVKRYGLTAYDTSGTVKSEVKKVTQYAAIVNLNDKKSSLNVRTSASASAPLMQVGGHSFCLPHGMVISIEAESNGFGKLTNLNGWISLAKIKK